MRQSGRTTKSLIKLAHFASNKVDIYYFISPSTHMARNAFDVFLRMFFNHLVKSAQRYRPSVELINGSVINFINEKTEDESFRGSPPGIYVKDHDVHDLSSYFTHYNRDLTNV